MNLTDELQKLSELHRDGHLTDSEFAEAKARLLGNGAAVPAVPTRLANTGTPAPRSRRRLLDKPDEDR